MGHNHDQGGHDQENHTSPLTFAEKAERLLAHWIKHNNDHAMSYRQWADAFRQHDLSDAAALLGAAAELTEQINQKLHQAAGLIADDRLTPLRAH